MRYLYSENSYLIEGAITFLGILLLGDNANEVRKPYFSFMLFLKSKKHLGLNFGKISVTELYFFFNLEM